MRPLHAKAILAALPLALLMAPSSHAEAQPASAASVAASGSATGGFAYEPLPNQASPVNPGSPPGESGGVGYHPSLLKRTSRPRSGTAPVPRGAVRTELADSSLHRFPLLGPHSLGGDDARFGARRPGHIHQGQDILADEGTPVVAPRGGTISWRGFQARGAGYYLVLAPVAEAFNYVFMHLQRGSVAVKLGERVRTGQQIASVGSTGTSSGPHLHFEIWQGRWFDGGHPIDPLPFLLAWDRGS